MANVILHTIPWSFPLVIALAWSAPTLAQPSTAREEPLDSVYAPASREGDLDAEAPRVAEMPSARDVEVPTSPAWRTQRRWYGWQNLLVWLASIATTPAYGLGLIGLVFGSPTVHWSHGHVGKGFAALGLNLGLTALGAVVGAGASCAAHPDMYCGLGGLLGGAAGHLLATIIDIAALASEPVEPDGEAASSRTRSLALLPGARVTPHSAAMTLGGAF